MGRKHIPFILNRLENHEAEYEVTELDDAYNSFWLPKFENEYIPKFLVSDWLQASKMKDMYYVGGFQFMPNPWHSLNGPGEHAGSETIIRWIAWYIPPRYRIIIEESLKGCFNQTNKLTCLSRDIAYNFNIPKTFDDETISDLPSKFSLNDKVLYTVRDLKTEDLPSLYALRNKIITVFQEKYGVEEHEIETYFHYPVKVRLSLLHLHICIGYKEKGLLAPRSHSLNDVISSIENKGYYSPINGFKKYYLNYSKDGSLHQILNALNNDKIDKDELDVVIPCDKKDAKVLPYCITSLRNNCSQIRRIIVISKEKYFDKDYVEWFNESLFHFSLSDVKSKWRYQQLLKLCSAFVIPNLLENILIVDADTIWRKKGIKFLEKGKAMYSFSNKKSDINGYDLFRKEVLEPLKINCFKDKSAIVHHMLFKKHILASMFTSIKKTFNKPIWELFSVNKPSEYELYFRYAYTNFREEIVVRDLSFKSISKISEMNDLETYDFYVCHSHNRLGKSGNHDNGDYLY